MAASATRLPASNGPFQRVAVFDLAPIPYVSHFHVTRENIVWLASGGTVAYLAGAQWRLLDTPPESVFIGVDSDGRPWVIADAGASVQVWLGDQWQVYGDSAGWQADHAGIRSGPVADAAGQLWWAAMIDLVHFANDQWSVVTLDDLKLAPPELEGAQVVHTLFADVDRDIWVGACYFGGPGPIGGGLRRLVNNTWQPTGSQLDDECVLAFANGAAGALWIGGEDAVWRYERDGQWLELPLPARNTDGERLRHVLDIAVDATGSPWPALWICGGASCGMGFQRYHLEGGQWISNDGWNTAALKPLFFDTRGVGWFFDNERSQVSSTSSEGFVSELSIRAVTQAPDGGIWFLASEFDGPFSLWLLAP